ncbi:MAG: tetratricopeptide repeat protein, partial [Verrucomicrobiota bacterium]|nr:tetratricopeptide repeat protein [Verrucomicrobiota bacterium]
MSESSEPDILFEGAEWFDQNKGKLLNGALFIIVAVIGWQLISKNQSDSKATSESALFAIQAVGATNLSKVAEAYGQVSVEQEGKPVAERALILSAKTWLEVSDYDKA